MYVVSAPYIRQKVVVVCTVSHVHGTFSYTQKVKIERFAECREMTTHLPSSQISSHFCKTYTPLLDRARNNRRPSLVANRTNE